jgi:ATPase subunit of ABC transporter with duplicated ATPase domains
MLDEPTTNLDLQGIQTLRTLLAEPTTPRLVLIATNDPADLDLCSSTISVEPGLATRLEQSAPVAPQGMEDGDEGVSR